MPITLQVTQTQITIQREEGGVGRGVCGGFWEALFRPLETTSPETTFPEISSIEATSPETTSPETTSPETASLETTPLETA